MASNRYSCSVECSRCLRQFKSSGATWRHMMKSHQLAMQPVEFLDQNNMPVTITKPTLISSQTIEYFSYIEWLVTVQERLNEALHPALPGRWTRIEDPCVPEDFVLHFLARILEQVDQVISPHSVKFLSHRGLPYKNKTQKISYRVYEMSALKFALEEQTKIRLCPSAAYRHQDKIDTALDTNNLTMREKIERMKASANKTYAERNELPTSRSSLVVSIGEGRSEVIYLLNLSLTWTYSTNNLESIWAQCIR